MKSIRLLLLPLAVAALPLSALADHKGHGSREYKEEYWDGHCKVERKMKKNGDYKEERKCKGVPHAHYAPAPVYAPAPAVVLPPITEPAITVHGTIRIKP